MPSKRPKSSATDGHPVQNFEPLRNKKASDARFSTHSPFQSTNSEHNDTTTQRLALAAALAAMLSACSITPDVLKDNGTAARPSTSASPRISRSPDTQQCMAELGAAKASFTPLPDQYFGGGCSQLGSVKLSKINLSGIVRNGAELDITNLDAVRCQLAQTFTGWAQFGVARAAEQMLGSKLVRIETFGSYSCRTIAGSGRLSEHAHANAIDVSAFVLEDGRRISVKNGWSGNANEREFLRVVRTSACKRFGTVLSPDYNSAHHDHFHLDMSGKNYCR